MTVFRTGIAVLLCVWSVAAAAGERLTGLPLPRFAAIRATEANLRVGPSKNYAVRWQYRRRGLPVRIVAEHFDWRRIEDPAGEAGWISAHLLADWPRVIVTGSMRRLRRAPRAEAAELALLEPNVVLAVLERRDGWCEVSVEGYRGWLRSDEVWGACADQQSAKARG